MASTSEIVGLIIKFPESSSLDSSDQSTARYNTMINGLTIALESV